MPNHVTPWWWPLTRRWGICGVIIFIGLVMLLIERGTAWYSEHISPPVQSREPQIPINHPAPTNLKASGQITP